MRGCFRSSALILGLCVASAAGQAPDPASPPASPSPAPQPSADPAPPSATEPTIPFVPLGHVESRGTGLIPMILIPGLACDWTVFDTFMTRNADRYTMHAVTLAGIGGSTPPQAVTGALAEQPWLTNAVQGVLKLIDEKSLEKPVVVGHSLGGHLALKMAAEYGDRLRAVVSIEGSAAFPLVDPSQPMPPQERRTFVEMTYGRQLSQMDQAAWQAQMSMMMPQLVTDPLRAVALSASSGAVPIATGGRYMLELMSADISEKLRTTTTPTLVIAALPPESAAVLPNQMVRNWWTTTVKQIPTGTLVVFENTRHFVTDDAPQELDRAIAQFLAGEPVEGKAAPAPGQTGTPAEPAVPPLESKPE